MSAKTKTELRKMKAAELARYASLELLMPEKDCYRYEGGPINKGLLIELILKRQHEMRGKPLIEILS